MQHKGLGTAKLPFGGVINGEYPFFPFPVAGKDFALLIDSAWSYPHGESTFSDQPIPIGLLATVDDARVVCVLESNHGVLGTAKSTKFAKKIPLNPGLD